MEFSIKLNKLHTILIATIISFAIAFTKYNFEANLTDIVIDAQAGIVVVFAFITSAILWALLTLSIYKLIRASINAERVKVISYALITAILMCLAAYSVGSSVEKKNALLDSANPATQPERLRELVGFQSGFGYEIDNRIARNPSTPRDVLESLYAIQGQVGTDFSLASNPNTPNDILIKLSKYSDNAWRDYILSSLERNPKVKRNKLYFDQSMVLHETTPSELSN
ncbi:hypothetical protein [Idiomarina sp. HP20-50]|uniref:hypothetical protein n=1 Tax=Idiomarina sp. HP20-50 TaxID=3070813 RepID=UPI00294AB959|nr:hypothetical protein [Idiomarina sp. HP20-50]MDV6314919.1 hypothetical protein [Idiomarina sp. HP20-50]